MYKCPFCRKSFKVPKTKNDTFLRELNITGTCPECYERIFNSPVISDWGKELGSCYCCDRPIYQKDIDKRPRCECGAVYELSLLTPPESKEAWVEKFKEACNKCPKLLEKLPKEVEDICNSANQTNVNKLSVTLLCASPFPVDESPEGIELVDRLLEIYLDANWE